MDDLIKIHESILKQYLICSGYQNNNAKTRSDWFEELNHSDIYIKKFDFYKLIITHFFMSHSTLFNINRYMEFHLLLDDFIDFLDLFGLKILEELDDYSYDEELSIRPNELLDCYRKISIGIFSVKINDIDDYYLAYLKAMNIDLNIDLSSNNRFKTSIIQNFKNISDCFNQNKVAYILNLEHIAFNYVYDKIMKTPDTDNDWKLAFLGKTFYDSYSFDLPFYRIDSLYSLYLKKHLLVLEHTLRYSSNLREKTIEKLIYSLASSNNYFDIEESFFSEFLTNKWILLSIEDRRLQVQLNLTLLDLISKTQNYNQEFFLSAIKSKKFRIDDYFLLLILGVEIDRIINNEFVYTEYKKTFEKIYQRVIHLKKYTFQEIDRVYDVLDKRKIMTLSDDIRQAIEDICLKQKDILNSVIFDQKNKYLEMINLESSKNSLLKENYPFSNEEKDFIYINSWLSNLASYLDIYYLDFYDFEVTEKMVNTYNEILDNENKKIIDKYSLKLESVSKKSGYKNESIFIERSIDKITNKSHRYFDVDIPISLQRDYINKLSKKSDFLRLYATSEFMYKIHIEDANSYDNMELTPIITGLLKGTEQMLKGFIEWYHHNKASYYSDIIIGNQNKNYLISENIWKEKLTIGNLSQHIVLNILPVILDNSKLQHLMHKISRSFQNWNTEIRNSKFHHSNIYAYDTNLEYIFDESYSIVRIIIQLMHLV